MVRLTCAGVLGIGGLGIWSHGQALRPLTIEAPSTLQEAQLQQRVEKLERQVQQLQSRLQKLEMSQARFHVQVVPPLVAVPKGSGEPLALPKGSIPQEFNGVRYYIVPLDKPVAGWQP